MKLFTIGYEGATQPDVIGRLKAAGVETLVDVRAVAASRRAGFSKTILGQSLKAEGIDYLHLRALGTPKAGRDAAKKGYIREMRAIFADHLAEPASQLQLAQLKALAGEGASPCCASRRTTRVATARFWRNSWRARTGSRW